MNLDVLGKFIFWRRVLARHILVSRLEDENEFSDLSWQVVEEMSNCIDWEDLSENSQLLTDNFLHQHARHLNFRKVVKNRKLSMDFLRTYPLALFRAGDYISAYQELTCDFIEEFIDLLDLDLVSKYQKLSSDFVRKHHRRLNM